MLAAAPGSIDPADLRARGFTKIDLGQGPLPHAAGGFRTPSGKLELLAAALGEQGIDPLPHYHPPAEVADEELAQRLPLALLTPKTHLFLNSTFANGVRQHAAQPEPMVYLNAADADAARDRRRRPRSRRQRPGRVPVPRGRLGRGAAGRRRGTDGLVEYRLRGRRFPSGSDTATAHAAG